MLGVAPALALDPAKTLTQYTHRIWGQEEGLFQPTIYAISQTRDGFLWLGTQDSLIRFDGAHFREFQKDNVAVLHGALVRTLLEDRSGSVWAGTIGSGIVRISARGEVTQFTAPRALPSNNVLCLDEGRDGSVWACTDQGLVRFKNNSSQTITSGLPRGGVRATCEAADGTRWVGGVDFGLESLSGGLKDVGSVASISTLACAKDGTIWAGTSNGVLRIEGDTVAHITTSSGLPDNAVNTITESADGSLWIGTDEGISRWRNGELSVYRTRDGLSHSVVLSIYFDREGTMWAGTKDGLDQFTNPKLTPYTTSEGLASNEAGPVTEDSAGRLWIGTLDAGLNVFDGKHFRKIGKRDGLASNRVLSLAAGAHGDLWVGTTDGLNHLVNGKISEVYARGREIRSLYVNTRGTVWAGTGTGLMRLKSHRVEQMTNSEAVVAIGQGGDATILASAGGGQLQDVSRKAGGTYTLNGVVRPVDCYLVDAASHSVWMGTLGSGLVRLRNGTISRVHVKDGLWDNRIYAVVRDQHDNFWFASSKGIFRVAVKQLEDFADGNIRAVTSFPFTTGQLRFECRGGVQPAATRTRDGRLWFATTSGVVVVDPEHLTDNLLPPPISITALYVNGERRETNQTLRLKPSEKNVEIRYAGLSFISPERVTFRYMLDGFDRDWTEAGTRREAFFTNLPPRTFHFRVMARSADGVWSREAVVMSFSVEPRLYQRRWFWPLVSLLLGLLILLAYRWRVREMQRSFNIVLAERSRIARELHDTLLQGLSAITMQMQALWMRMPASHEKRVLRAIIEDAGQCSTEARQSLWGLRAAESGPASFPDQLERVCRETVAHTALRLELDIQPVELEQLPDTQYQLLRIAKESLLNTIKHAEATVVCVTLHNTGGFPVMTISDDGKGFDPHQDYGKKGHFGLSGIRERVREIGGILKIKSSRTGTVLSVTTGSVIEADPVNQFVEQSDSLE